MEGDDKVVTHRQVTTTGLNLTRLPSMHSEEKPVNGLTCANVVTMKKYVQTALQSIATEISISLKECQVVA